MTVKYYVLPEERRLLKEQAVEQVADEVTGLVGFYEHWLGEAPRLTIIDKALRQSYHSFCELIWQDKELREQSLQDYEARAAACTEPQISLSWLGIHNVCLPVVDEDDDGGVTLVGGQFRVYERKAEAEKQLERFLDAVPSEQIEVFRRTWHQVPELREAEVYDHTMRELALAGRSYLQTLKQHSSFRYRADLTTHDVVIALQALIADIEVLKIELQDTFGIGKKWQERFEALIRMAEDHNTYLETRLGVDKPRYLHYSVSKLIYECVGKYLPKAKAQGIEIRVDLEHAENADGSDRALAIRMDRDALGRALLNVLDNAVKYSFSGTPDHPRWIEVVGRPQSRQGVSGYTIAVSNLGIGIDEDELELVFEPGYQGRRRLDEGRSGYGMGLTFVKGCVERHGGVVSIHSQPQRRTGWLTTVDVWLPLRGPVE